MTGFGVIRRSKARRRRCSQAWPTTAAIAALAMQFDPVGSNKFDTTSCDIVKNSLAKSGVNYTNVAASERTVASGSFGSETIPVPSPAGLPAEERETAIAAFGTKIAAELQKVGYPTKADPNQMNKPLVVGLLFWLVLLVTMAYGPIAAMLVELFPSRIRYTSMSLPYHIGNGWLGGLLPAIGFAMVAANGDIYYGLWYPVVVVAVATAVIGLFILPETFRRSIDT